MDSVKKSSSAAYPTTSVFLSDFLSLFFACFMGEVLIDEVHGASFNFIVHAGDVFPDYSEAQQLQAAPKRRCRHD